MSRLLGSVRFRVTAIATAVVIALLSGASIIILRLVERDLIDEAESVVADAIATLQEGFGEDLPADALLEYETEAGTVFIGLVAEDDAIVGIGDVEDGLRRGPRGAAGPGRRGRRNRCGYAPSPDC